MRTFHLVRKILHKHYLPLSVAVSLLTISSFIEATSIVSIAPIIDLLTQPDLNEASVISAAVIGWMEYFRLPVSVASLMTLYLVITVGKNLIAATAKFVVTKVHFRLMQEFIITLFKDFVSARLRFFVANNYGVLGNTLLRETQKVGLAFEMVAQMLSDVLRMVFYATVAILISWKLSVLVIGVVGLVLLPFLLLGKITYNIGLKHTAAGNTFQGTIVETFDAIKIVLGFGNQMKSVDRLMDSLTPYVTTAVQFVMIRAITPLAFEPLTIAIAFLVLYLGLYYYKLEMSELFIFLYSFRSSSSIALNLTNQRNSLQNMLPALEQIERLREEAQQKEQFSGTHEFQVISQGVTLKDVSFSYFDNKQVLKSVNLTIPKGKMVALVGKSGSGKTTLTDLLMGLYEVNSGQVLVDNIPLGEINITSWRQKIGFVPQDAFLFHASIRDNLLWATDHASDEEILRVCEQANAKEFIDQLPQRLDTIVGERGIRLSGGQRQRIALARALLRKPEILILDEATSALDSHSELLIQQAIENTAQKIAVVVVAHRLSTIKKADCIYVLENGSVVESGTFEELMNIHGGKFLRLAELQGLNGHH